MALRARYGSGLVMTPSAILRRHLVLFPLKATVYPSKRLYVLIGRDLLLAYRMYLLLFT